MGTDKKISRALISVTDKTGVVEFAQSLVSDYGVEIISTAVPRACWKRPAFR